MKRLLLPNLFLVLMTNVVGGGSSLAGQEGRTVQAIPRLGLLSPDSYFYEEFTSFAGDAPDEWTSGSLGRAAVAGVGIELGWKSRGILLRGEVARSFDGWLSAVHAKVVPRVLFDPPEITYTWYDVPAAITFANLQLVLPTQFEVRGVRAYGLIGGGGKWYHFGESTEENTAGAIFPSDGFTAALDLGGGLTFTVLGLVFDAQLKDTVNKYWGKTQHDLVLTGGLVWRIR